MSTPSNIDERPSAENAGFSRGELFCALVDRAEILSIRVAPLQDVDCAAETEERPGHNALAVIVVARAFAGTQLRTSAVGFAPPALFDDIGVPIRERGNVFRLSEARVAVLCYCDFLAILVHLVIRALVL